MDKKMRVMTERPLNAEIPNAALLTWITGNDVFQAQSGVDPGINRQPGGLASKCRGVGKKMESFQHTNWGEAPKF